MCRKCYTREKVLLDKMTPIGLLMIEHGLIERIVPILNNELERIDTRATVDQPVLDSAVDFRIYADRCHHGKEEDILFRVLEEKTLSEGHRVTLHELFKEHVLARRLTSQLAATDETHSTGSKECMDDIHANLEALTKLYPTHIEKEDRHFFIPCMEYFTKQEQDLMLEFHEFDRRLIHDRYGTVVENLEQHMRRG